MNKYTETLIPEIKLHFNTLNKRMQTVIEEAHEKTGVDMNIVTLHKTAQRDLSQADAIQNILKTMTFKGKPAYSLADVYILDILSGYGDVHELYEEFTKSITLAPEKPELLFLLELVKSGVVLWLLSS